MKCPFCNSDQLIITNSRPTNNKIEIWRRRKCLKCGEMLTTHKKIDLSFITIIKRNGKHVKYNRVKIYSGIYQAVVATKKIDRGLTENMAEKIMKEAEKQF